MTMSLEVDVGDDDQRRAVTKRFVDAVMPALAATFRRYDTPVLRVLDMDELETQERS
jgi:hypothetical protein